jgi:hypothetical protein
MGLETLAALQGWLSDSTLVFVTASVTNSVRNAGMPAASCRPLLKQTRHYKPNRQHMSTVKQHVGYICQLTPPA